MTAGVLPVNNLVPDSRGTLTYDRPIGFDHKVQLKVFHYSLYIIYTILVTISGNISCWVKVSALKLLFPSRFQIKM